MTTDGDRGTAHLEAAVRAVHEGIAMMSGGMAAISRLLPDPPRPTEQATEALREVSERGTPGTWRQEFYRDGTGGIDDHGTPHSTVYVIDEEDPDGHCLTEFCTERPEDAALIVAAVNDLRARLAEPPTARTLGSHQSHRAGTDHAPAPLDAAQVLRDAADEMQAVIANGESAAACARVPGEVGRSAGIARIARRDSLHEKPDAWLRDYAERLAASEPDAATRTVTIEETLRGRIARAEALLAAWEHDALGLVDPTFAGRLREVLRRDPAPVRLRDAADPTPAAAATRALDDDRDEGER